MQCGVRLRRAWLAGAIALAGCDDPLVIAPVIDVPTDDADATATQLDEITLTVAHAGSDQDLVSQTFATGAPLELPGVPFGDDLVIHMSGYVGATNVAYGRTCAVAVSPTTAPPTPHLFFSRTAKFANFATVPLARLGGLGISYLGTGLLVGGDDATGQPVSTVERYDPLTGELSTLGTVSPRDGAVEALVGTSPPQVLLIGGSASGAGAGFIEVINNRGVDRLDFTELARTGLTATALTDGRVIAIGGIDPAAPAGASPSGEIDELTQDGLSVDFNMVTAQLAHPRYDHTATRLGEDVGAPVLIAGGFDATHSPIDVAELFKPLSEELANPATFAPKLNVPRASHAAALMPDGSVLIIGGVNALGQPVNTLELFSVDAGFTTVGSLPPGAGVVDLTATTLPDGRILLAGGRLSADSPPLNSAYIVRLDPLAGQLEVVATDHLAVARAGHQAMLLCDGTVLISGGTSIPYPAERYNPPPTGRR